MALKVKNGGVRRFQNEDGSLTSAGMRRYDSKTNLGTSSNIFLGRRVNASKEERKAHGKALVDQGRGRAGAVGRWFVRGAVISAVSACMQAPLSAAIENANDNGKNSYGAAAALNVVKLGTTVASATSTVKAWQDFRDIKTYRNSR